MLGATSPAPSSVQLPCTLRHASRLSLLCATMMLGLCEHRVIVRREPAPPFSTIPLQHRFSVGTDGFPPTSLLPARTPGAASLMCYQQGDIIYGRKKVGPRRALSRGGKQDLNRLPAIRDQRPSQVKRILRPSIGIRIAQPWQWVIRWWSGGIRDG